MHHGRKSGAALAALLVLSAANAARAHPHVFAEARMEIVGTEDGKLASVRNIWRMDELFSSAVLFDFDADRNGELDESELAAVGAVVRESIAEWGFYTFVEVDGFDVPMHPPDEIRTLWQDGQLLMFFEMKAEGEVDLTDSPATFSVFDDSFFVAFDFEGENAFALFDMPANCGSEIHVPDPDEAAAQWMEGISMLQPDEAVPDDGVDWGAVFSTTMKVSC